MKFKGKVKQKGKWELKREKMESDLLLKWVVEAGAGLRFRGTFSPGLKLSLIRSYNYSNTNVDQNNACYHKINVQLIIF